MFINQRGSELECSQAFLQACLGQKLSSGPQHLQMKVLRVMFSVVQKLLPTVSVPNNLNCSRNMLVLNLSFRMSSLYMHSLHSSPDQCLLGWNSQDQAMVCPDPPPWLRLQNLELNPSESSINVRTKMNQTYKYSSTGVDSPNEYKFHSYEHLLWVS